MVGVEKNKGLIRKFFYKILLLLIILLKISLGGWMFDEKIECVEKLLKPSKKVLKLGKEINYFPFEKRVSLWNEIMENYESYLDGSCGSFLSDVDMHIRSQFEMSLLILALSFKLNNEDFKSAGRFNDREMEIYEKISRYDVFEILDTKDIKKKIVSKDKEILGLFEDYYVYMDKWVEEVLEDPSLKLPLRYYLKNKWEKYKEKINKAVSELIAEIDWFGTLISEWKREAESKAEEMVEKVKDEMKKVVEEEKKKIEIKEREILEKENKIRSILEELKGIKEKVEKGSRFVKVDEAKQYELNFIGRIERKLENEVKIFGKKFKVKEIKESKGVNSLRFEGFDGDVRNLPENRYIEAKLVEKKWFGKKKRYILKALFVSRVERYAKYGFDTDPLELKDINVHIIEERDRAKEEGCTRVLCLASPTGFEDTVKEHISGDEFHKNFLSKYLSICLLDLETGKLIYNPHDEVAREFAKICEIEIDKEKIARVEKCICNMMEGKEWITLEDVLNCGEGSIVKTAFYNVAEKNGWKVKFVEGVGLVLMR